MRTIKFRAWDGAKMVFPTQIDFEGEAAFIPQDDTSYRKIERPELMQYTGLKDKNGKEIYEGDIIEHWDDRYVVPTFTPLSRFYEAENVKAHHEGSDDWMAMSDCDWEVIGNIYEHPHLLETTQ